MAKRSTAEPAPEAAPARRRNVREDIYAAALACFEQQGVRRTLMEDVARQAGVSRPTIYYYFPVIRIFGGEPPSAAELPRLTTYVRVTPFLIVILITALLLLLRALFVPPASRGALVWPAAATLVFFYIHIASVAHLPELLSVHRNAAWFAGWTGATKRPSRGSVTEVGSSPSAARASVRAASSAPSSAASRRSSVSLLT